MAYNSEKHNTESIMTIARQLKDLGATSEGYYEQIGMMAGLVLIACRIENMSKADD